MTTDMSKSKYDSLRTQVIYTRMIADAECGSVDGLGWCGLYLHWEREGGYILKETMDGFVSRVTYSSDSEIQASWDLMVVSHEVSGDPSDDDFVIEQDPRTGILTVTPDPFGGRAKPKVPTIDSYILWIKKDDPDRPIWLKNENGNFVLLYFPSDE